MGFDAVLGYNDEIKWPFKAVLRLALYSIMEE